MDDHARPIEISTDVSAALLPPDDATEYTAAVVEPAGEAVRFTVVVPTRNEKDNIAVLLGRLQSAVAGQAAEILFVDDSDDETPAVIRDLADQFEMPVRLLHREPGRRDGGLGGAVVAGFQLARGTWAIVMDGDLQHPPESVPALIGAVHEAPVDLVYGTRYEGTGSAAGLSGRLRIWVSSLATVLAKMVFPRRLRGISDPMSGFFAVRLAALDLAHLRPTGYKVLLEIITGSQLGASRSVPYEFEQRFAGNSKASVSEGMLFFRRLAGMRLRSVHRVPRALGFLAVGLTGVAVNTVTLWLLSGALFTVPYLIASAIATNVAILWNFTLLESVVFRRVRSRTYWPSLSRFWLINIALLPVQLLLLALMVEGAALDPLPANLIALVVVFGVRYVMTSRWVYRTGKPRHGRSRLEAVVDWRRAHLGSTMPRPPAIALQVLQLALPVAATLIAFPAITVELAGALVGGGGPATALLLAVACAAGITAHRLSPAPGEPDVHDRQLDVILALPFVGGGLWLALDWPVGFGLDEPVTGRQIIAATAFLVGGCLLILGTRLTARLRLALLLPLLALPPVADRPGLLLTLLGVALVGTAFLLVVRPRRRALTDRGHAPSPDPVVRHALPRFTAAGAALLAVAVVLLVSALRVDHPAPRIAQQPLSGTPAGLSPALSTATGATR